MVDLNPGIFKCLKLGKNRGSAVEAPRFFPKYDPDPLCVYNKAPAPETHDTEAFPACAERSSGKARRVLERGFCVAERQLAVSGSVYASGKEGLLPCV